MTPATAPSPFAIPFRHGPSAAARVARAGAIVLTVAVLTLAILAATAPRAVAFDPFKKACDVAGVISKLAGKACGVLQGGKLVKAGKQLLGGNLSGAGKALLGGGAKRIVGFAAVGAWALGGAKAALHETEKEIGKTTSPRLQTTWFSSRYWRVAGIGALLTLPFLFAAAIQALIRSDLSLLAHAAFGYLPLALLAVSIAAPLTMLMLAASDEMCTIVSSAFGGAGVGFLRSFGGAIGLLSAVDGSPFLAFLIGAMLAGAALAVSLELLLREAAVYVVVLMLPLAFAGMVWPARRIWAVRAVETLVALILAKFAIVAVLALAGGALGTGGASAMLAGTALLMLAAFSPFVLFRLLPFAELAAGASGALRGEGSRFDSHARTSDALSGAVEMWGMSLTGGMNDDLERSAAADRDTVAAPRFDSAEPSGRASRAALGPAGPGADGGAQNIGPDGDSGNRPVGAEAALDGLSGVSGPPGEPAGGEVLDAPALAPTAPEPSQHLTVGEILPLRDEADGPLTLPDDVGPMLPLVPVAEPEGRDPEGGRL